METMGMTEDLGDGRGGYGPSGGALCRVPAARAPPGVGEGGTAEMETGKTNEDLGDGGGGYMLSGGGPFREPAARAPSGASGGAAAEMETTGTTEGLGDGGDGDQDGGSSGRIGGGNRDLGHPVRPRPAEWGRMTKGQRRYWTHHRHGGGP